MAFFVTSDQLLFCSCICINNEDYVYVGNTSFSFMHQKFENFNIFHRGKNSILLVQFSQKRITISKFAEPTLEFI